MGFDAVCSLSTDGAGDRMTSSLIKVSSTSSGEGEKKDHVMSQRTGHEVNGAM